MLELRASFDEEANQPRNGRTLERRRKSFGRIAQQKVRKTLCH